MLRNIRAIRSGYFRGLRFTSSDAAKSSGVKEGEKPRPTYALKEDFPHLKDKIREEQKADADTGLKPTDWQKRMLVFTRLYKDKETIPEYVPAPTMRLLSNRIRAYIVFTLAFTVSAIWIFGNTKIRQNRPLMDNAVTRINSSMPGKVESRE